MRFRTQQSHEFNVFKMCVVGYSHVFTGISGHAAIVSDLSSVDYLVESEAYQKMSQKPKTKLPNCNISRP